MRREMADKKKRTLRQLGASAKAKKPRKLANKSKKVSRPLGKVARAGKKEFHPIKLPDNRLGRIFEKKVRFIPRYFSEAWEEVRKVTWPNRQETIKLTFAVLVFSVVFSVIVATLDYGLDKLFREIITR